MCFSYLFTYVSTFYILTFILNNLKNWICVFFRCIFAISIKKKRKDMKTQKQNYTLYGSQHTWDMNYHLLDNQKKIEYLISTDDVSDDEDEGLYIETLINLEDIDEILSYVWKAERYISDSYVNLLSGSKKTITDLLKELVNN